MKSLARAAAVSSCLLAVAPLAMFAAAPRSATAIDAAATMVVVAGSGTPGFADGTADAAQFNKPIRLAPSGPDAVVVSDIFNHAIRVVTKDGKVRTLAGAPDRKGSVDGDAKTASFNSPHGVGTDPKGRIAIAEAGSHALRLMTPDASAPGGYTVTTLAGVSGEKGNRDGAAAQALFNSPHAALWATDGTLFTPDIGNAAIRRVSSGVVSTFAGADKGTFVYPMDIAWAKDGRLLVADAGNNTLRAVTPEGTVATVATDSALATPHGVASGPDGTITSPTWAPTVCCPSMRTAAFARSPASPVKRAATRPTFESPPPCSCTRAGCGLPISTTTGSAQWI